MKRRSTVLAIAASSIGIPLFAQTPLAGAFPTKPIKILVPYPAGGFLDGAARQVGNGVSALWGQPVVVDNRPGASGAIAAGELSRSQPDGHTVMAEALGSLVITALISKRQVDPQRDLSPIGTISQHPLFFAVRAGLPVKDLAELAALAKSKPKSLTHGSPGKGTESHLVIEMFKHAAGVDIVHVPYKGGSLAMVDLQAGRLDMFVSTIIPLRAGLERNEIRVLATLSPKRVSIAPQVPTVAEAGFAAMTHSPTTALFAPGKTPPYVITAWGEVLNAIKGEKALSSWAEASGSEVTIGGAKQLAELLNSEVRKWKPIVDKLDLSE
ncbi:MAG: Tricarboxylate transport protein TctC [Ramlibacter sp.]|nr:Tricarboxylate transport protein TctC [Ramlibacter sp.]